MARQKYRNLSLPESLCRTVEEAIESPKAKGGYASVTEFAKVAIREKLQALGFKI